MTEEEIPKEKGKLIVGPWPMSNDVSRGADFSSFSEPQTFQTETIALGEKILIPERMQKISTDLGRVALEFLNKIAKGQEALKF